MTATRATATPELTEAERLNQRLASEGNVPPPPLDTNPHAPRATSEEAQRTKSGLSSAIILSTVMIAVIALAFYYVS